MILVSLFTVPASASIVWEHSPTQIPILCAYMAAAPADDVHWDGDDPSPYNGGDYILGSTSAQYNSITWECDDSWLSVSFGPDIDPTSAWKRKVFINSLGVEHTSQCRVSHNHNGTTHVWFVFDVFSE